MPAEGTKRRDGFIWGGSKWRSPGAHKRYIVCKKRYAASAKRYTSGGRATPGNAGESGEFLVAHDLLFKGLQVTKPLNRNGADDLHAKFSCGWKTIQVKLGKVNIFTSTISPNNCTNVSSAIIALVDLEQKRIRYISNGKRLPKELK